MHQFFTLVSGYKFHYGTSSRNNDVEIDVGLPEIIDGRIIASVAGLQVGQTYYFATTAHSANGESGYFVGVMYTITGSAGSAPLLLRV